MARRTEQPANPALPAARHLPARLQTGSRLPAPPEVRHRASGYRVQSATDKGLSPWDRRPPPASRPAVPVGMHRAGKSELFHHCSCSPDGECCARLLPAPETPADAGSLATGRQLLHPPPPPKPVGADPSIRYAAAPRFAAGLESRWRLKQLVALAELPVLSPTAVRANPPHSHRSPPGQSEPVPMQTMGSIRQPLGQNWLD